MTGNTNKSILVLKSPIRECSLTEVVDIDVVLVCPILIHACLTDELSGSISLHTPLLQTGWFNSIGQFCKVQFHCTTTISAVCRGGSRHCLPLGAQASIILLSYYTYLYISHMFSSTFFFIHRYCELYIILYYTCLWLSVFNFYYYILYYTLFMMSSQNASKCVVHGCKSKGK